MVAILLSTYNGQLYIKKLLDSLINQTYSDYKIYIRDDGSIDNTINIIKTYLEKYPNKIEIIKDNLGNIGVRHSFEKLMKEVNANYYFFCDQDDVWYNNKLEVIISKIKDLELVYKEKPILVFSDMKIIDSKDKIIKESFIKHSKYKNSYKENVLFRGFVPGCSTAFNNVAKLKYLEFTNIMGHDGFMFMIVNLFGYISPVSDQLMNYRVHENNTVGLGKRQPIILLLKDLIKYVFNNKAYRHIILNTYFKQIDLLSNKIKNNLLIYLELFNEEQIYNMPYLKRKKWYLKHFVPFNRGFFDGLVGVIIF